MYLTPEQQEILAGSILRILQKNRGGCMSLLMQLHLYLFRSFLFLLNLFAIG